MEINKRTITKFTAKLAVSYGIGHVIIKTLHATIPATREYKLAEIAGAVGGWVASEKLEPHTNSIVDEFYDWQESKTKKN